MIATRTSTMMNTTPTMYRRKDPMTGRITLVTTFMAPKEMLLLLQKRKVLEDFYYDKEADYNHTEASSKEEGPTTANSTTANTTTIAASNGHQHEQPSQQQQRPRKAVRRTSQGLPSKPPSRGDSTLLSHPHGVVLGGGHGSGHDSDSSSSSPPAVSFGEVRIRCHERILNQQISGKFAGLELGWAHTESIVRHVDGYEQIKLQRQRKCECGSVNGSNKTSSTAEELGGGGESLLQRMASSDRLNKLCEYGYPTKQIMTLEKEKSKSQEAIKNAQLQGQMKIVESKKKYSEAIRAAKLEQETKLAVMASMCIVSSASEEDEEESIITATTTKSTRSSVRGRKQQQQRKKKQISGISTGKKKRMSLRKKLKAALFLTRK